jgi:CheY-like chemotaxis protein
MAGSSATMNGRRILVVEDNFLAAEVVRDTLESYGCQVVGPVGRLEDGLRLASAEALDGAVLDINLNGERCFPIAKALLDRGVPFMFLTGYDDAGLIPPELRPTRRVGKPILGHQLITALAEVLTR